MTIARKPPTKTRITSVRVIVRRERANKTLASACATLDPAAIRGMTPRQILDRLLGETALPRPKP